MQFQLVDFFSHEMWSESQKELSEEETTPRSLHPLCQLFDGRGEDLELGDKMDQTWVNEVNDCHRLIKA
jgi:hypothetical protein